MEFIIPGLILGYASSRGRFCLNSGFVDAAFKADFRKVNILLMAVLIQAAFGIGYAFIGKMPVLAPHNLLVIFSGGFIFGLFMPLSGGCPGGILFKATEGQIPAFFSLAGFLLAMGIFYKSPAQSILSTLHSIYPTPDLHIHGTGIFVWAALALAALVYFLFFVKDAKPEGALWSWKKSGVFIGVATILYSALSLFRSDVAPLGFMPGFISAWHLDLSPQLWFVIAVFLGGVIAAVVKGGFSLKRAAGALYLKRLAGGLGLGAAASVAMGCSVGYGLTFLPLLSLHAVVAIGAIFLGRIVAEKIRRRAV